MRMLTSFEPHPGETLSERHFVRKPADIADGTRIVSEPAQDLTTLRTRAQRQPPNKQAHLVGDEEPRYG